MIDSSLLTRTTGPWLMCVSGSESELTNELWRLGRESSRSAVRILQGSRMRSFDAAMNETAAALQFPYYFGGNMAALRECITDLEWLNATAFLLAVFDADRVLEAEAINLRKSFWALLANTGKTWSMPIASGEAWDRPAVPFHVILQLGNTSDDETCGLIAQIHDELGTHRTEP